MNLGISVFDDRLLLVRHHGIEDLPEFWEHHFKQKPNPQPPPGYIWNLVDVAAGDAYRTADNLILSVPAPICYLKRLEIDSNLIKDYPDYLEWLACTRMPGDISQYKYEFIPIGQSYDGSMIEMVFSAIPLGPLNLMLRSFKRQNDPREIIPIPEQLGLIKVLQKSLSSDDIPQAGIINCTSLGAIVILIKSNRLCHNRYFPIHADHPEDLTVDIETYLLSQSDSTEALPIVITGNPELLETTWAPIHPPFLSSQDLEFAAAWGAAEYYYSSGAK